MKLKKCPLKNKPTYVTMPSLAPLAEFNDLLQGVWERGILTHNGPLVQEFEKKLAGFLGLQDFVAVSNGTVALQMAIKALKLKGEIITTPFTWIASISSIMWEGCTPVFADIDPGTLNISPEKIVEKITNNTVGIMPVHVFGNCCDVDAITAIAEQYKLPVIYDAAHAIGSLYKEKSLLEYGTISCTSLHATKILNTGEGGGCISNDLALVDKLKRIRFFGHDDSKDIVEEGFNGKMTEIHAALGLANLKYLQDVLTDRKLKYEHYQKRLGNAGPWSLQIHKWGMPNYSYFPLIFETENDLEKCVEKLGEKEIFPRRYFYPSVNQFSRLLPYQPAPVAEDIAKRILCLPLYWELSLERVDEIADIIISIK